MTSSEGAEVCTTPTPPALIRLHSRQTESIPSESCQQPLRSAVGQLDACVRAYVCTHLLVLFARVRHHNKEVCCTATTRNHFLPKSLFGAVGWPHHGYICSVAPCQAPQLCEDDAFLLYHLQRSARTSRCGIIGLYCLWFGVNTSA